ncbi:hypothetical protein M4S82_10490 [Planococcus sp. MERTA32b]|nr:hypothetical protein [Planococcus sp. MER TA 32b]
MMKEEIIKVVPAEYESFSTSHEKNNIPSIRKKFRESGNNEFLKSIEFGCNFEDMNSKSRVDNWGIKSAFNKQSELDDINFFEMNSVNSFTIISKSKKPTYVSTNSINSNEDNYSGDTSWHDQLKKNNFEFKVVTENFLNMIRNDIFEAGYSSSSEDFFKSMLKDDPSNTKKWLNSVYLRNFYDVKVLVGILHIISHIDYEVVFPEGQTMAVAALMHQDIEVREYALKAFENWGHAESLSILRNIKCEENWLQDYLNDIISDLTEG